MDKVFSSPGMLATAAIILVVQAMSLLLMMLIIHVFKQQRAKYIVLLRNMDGETSLGTPGRILIPMYGCMTVAVASVTLYLFIFQPHVL